MEGTSQLVKDCDAWRDEYRILVKQYDELNSRHQKLKIDVNNAEYELERCIPASTYNALQNKYDGLEEESAAMSKELSELRAKIYSLELSNKHMEGELFRVRKANQSLGELNDERLAQIRHLKSRGFWARMFNR